MHLAWQEQTCHSSSNSSHLVCVCVCSIFEDIVFMDWRMSLARNSLSFLSSSISFCLSVAAMPHGQPSNNSPAVTTSTGARDDSSTGEYYHGVLTGSRFTMMHVNPVCRRLCLTPRKIKSVFLAGSLCRKRSEANSVLEQIRCSLEMPEEKLRPVMEHILRQLQNVLLVLKTAEDRPSTDVSSPTIPEGPKTGNNAKMETQCRSLFRTSRKRKQPQSKLILK